MTHEIWTRTLPFCTVWWNRRHQFGAPNIGSASTEDEKTPFHNSSRIPSRYISSTSCGMSLSWPSICEALPDEWIRRLQGRRDYVRSPENSRKRMMVEMPLYEVQMENTTGKWQEVFDLVLSSREGRGVMSFWLLAEGKCVDKQRLRLYVNVGLRK